MDNEEITIINNGRGMLSVAFGRLKNARLEWYAPGLSIYKSGAFPVALYATACNLAMSECIARHIPVISLKRVIKDVH